MPDVILAIVGSTQFALDTKASLDALDVIRDRVSRLNPVLIVSGGAPGIDEMAAEYAKMVGIPCREFLPLNKRWKPKGFAARNLAIAEACTHLLAIRHPHSSTYGSGRTADRAAEMADRTEEMGKSVERVTIRLDTA